MSGPLIKSSSASTFCPSTSTPTSSIPHTSYRYPRTETIGGVNYTLVAGSLSGCNEGASSTPVAVCEVSVAAGASATISATYKRTRNPLHGATLKAQSIPPGVHISTFWCFTVTASTCSSGGGTTSWTSTNAAAIPTKTYQYPQYATIGGAQYT